MEYSNKKSGTKIGIIMESSNIRTKLVCTLRTSDNTFSVHIVETVRRHLALKAGATDFDIILLEANRLDFNLVSEIKAASLKIQVPGIIVLFDSTNHNSIVRAIALGADACILVKENIEEIYDAIASVKNGGCYLSPAIAKILFRCIAGELPEKIWHKLTFMEKKVVAAIVEEQLVQKQAAQKLNISYDTVRYHLKKVYKKLKINSAGQLSSLFLAEKYNSLQHA
jgi:DNA-binding NarL/FixJ family response regulator